jgi:hypothetical protein
MHMRCAPQKPRGFHDRATVMRGGDFEIVLLGDEQIVRERVFRFDQRTSAARERLRPRAHARDKQIAQFIPAGKAELLRQTHERCGLHLRALSHLAHGGHRDLVRMIEQESCAHLELRAQFGETRADQGGELVEAVWHAKVRASRR